MDVKLNGNGRAKGKQTDTTLPVVKIVALASKIEKRCNTPKTKKFITHPDTNKEVHLDSRCREIKALAKNPGADLKKLTAEVKKYEKIYATSQTHLDIFNAYMHK